MVFFFFFFFSTLSFLNYFFLSFSTNSSSIARIRIMDTRGHTPIFEWKRVLRKSAWSYAWREDVWKNAAHLHNRGLEVDWLSWWRSSPPFHHVLKRWSQEIQPQREMERERERETERGRGSDLRKFKRQPKAISPDDLGCQLPNPSIPERRRHQSRFQISHDEAGDVGGNQKMEIEFFVQSWRLPQGKIEKSKELVTFAFSHHLTYQLINCTTRSLFNQNRSRTTPFCSSWTYCSKTSYFCSSCSSCYGQSTDN